MAVALTVEQLAVALGVIGTADQAIPAETRAELLRLHTLAAAQVVAFAPLAPSAAQDEAVVRLCGWLYDTDPAGRPGTDPLTLSGAAGVLARYREQRLVTGGLVEVAPAPGAGVDQQARDAAAAAGAAAAANARKLMPPSPNEAAAAAATSIRGWTAALIRVAVESIVPAWARAAAPPMAGGLPALPEDGHDYTLQGRHASEAEPIQFWSRPNFVPDTPGTQSGIGHVLTAIGEGDRDYAFRAPVAVDANARVAARQALTEAGDAQTTADTANQKATEAVSSVGVVNRKAEANAAEIERRAPWASVTPSPIGISGSDYPEFINLIFQHRQVNKAVKAIRVRLGGQTMQIAAVTPLSNIAAATGAGTLIYSFTSQQRDNLKTNTRPTDEWKALEILFTFSDDTTATQNTVFLVNAPQLAVAGGGGVKRVMAATRGFTAADGNVAIGTIDAATPRGGIWYLPMYFATSNQGTLARSNQNSVAVWVDPPLARPRSMVSKFMSFASEGEEAQDRITLSIATTGVVSARAGSNVVLSRLIDIWRGP